MYKQIVSAFVAAAVLSSVGATPVRAVEADLLAAPSNLMFVDKTATSVTLQWTDNSKSETDFVIYESSDGVTFNSVNVPSNDTNGVGGTQQYVYNQLTPDTGYWFRVVAHDANNNADSAQAENSSPVITYAAKPGEPTVGVITTDSIRLTLNENGNPVYTQYAVLYTDETANHGSAVDQFGIANPDAGIVYMTKADWDATGLVRGLKAGHTYYFRIFSINSDGESPQNTTAYLDTNEIMTLGDPTKPAVPMISNASANDNTITVSWKANPQPGTETKYVVGYSKDNGNTFTDVELPLAGDGSPDVCVGELGPVIGCYQYTFGSLDWNAQYTLRVATKDDNNISDYSSGYAQTAYNAPVAPTVSNVTDSSADITLGKDGNPNNTTYLVGLKKVFSDGTFGPIYFVNADGSLADDRKGVNVRFTSKTISDWGTVTVKGLDSITSYVAFAMVADGDKKISPISAIFKTLVANVPVDNGGGSSGNSSNSSGSSSGGGGGASYYGPVPSNPAITIVSNTTNLTNNTVQVKLDATNNPTEVALSLNKDFSGISWQPLASTMTYNFGSNAGGAVTIYAKFKNNNGESTVVSAPLFLERTASVITGGQVLGAKI